MVHIMLLKYMDYYLIVFLSTAVLFKIPLFVHFYQSIAMLGDLYTLSFVNDIFKHGDYTNLLVPQHTDASIDAEFNNILRWSELNELVISAGKNKGNCIS